jgi:RimJ/RimL family protein N-acetyltransferase
VDDRGWKPTGGPPLPAGADLATDHVVRLRPVSVSDAAEHATGQDAEWRRWLGAGHGSAEGAANWLSRCERCWCEPHAIRETRFVFGLRAADDEALLGTVEVQVGESALPPGRASLSCGLYPKARGRGLGARACRLASSFALRSLAGPPWDVTVVVAQIDPFNGASLRMIVQAGFGHVSSCVAGGEAWEQFERSAECG